MWSEFSEEVELDRGEQDFGIPKAECSLENGVGRGCQCIHNPRCSIRAHLFLVVVRATKTFAPAGTTTSAVATRLTGRPERSRQVYHEDLHADSSLLR